jgi:hypothetical protein
LGKISRNNQYIAEKVLPVMLLAAIQKKNEDFTTQHGGGLKFQSLVMVFSPCGDSVVSENLWLLGMRI